MIATKVINRRSCREIKVGAVAVGGGAPISVQSMTNTDTCDIAATVQQIEALQGAGADIVRVSVPTIESADAFAAIRAEVGGDDGIPLVADIHFDYKIALKVLEGGVDCLRLNPGNIGNDTKVRSVISSAREHKVPLRIGVNAGSLEKSLQRKYGEPNAHALVESALRHVAILERLDYPDFKISVKASEIFMAVEAYELLAQRVDQPLHLGITEAGGLRSGTVKSAAGLGALLMQGIGDTIRISLAADPVEEVRVGWDLLKSLHLRSRGINFVACPSCSRQNFDVIATVNELEQRLEDVLVPLDVAIIGCYVNGPGESKMADIGLTGSSPNNMLFVDGKPAMKLPADGLVEELEKVIRSHAKEKQRQAENLVIAV